MGKASTKAQNKYIAKAYDRVNLVLPKGQKDIIKAHAESQGESVNGFISRAIENQMERDKIGYDIKEYVQHDEREGANNE